jgi:hypothetical protein
LRLDLFLRLRLRLERPPDCPPRTLGAGAAGAGVAGALLDLPEFLGAGGADAAAEAGTPEGAD